MGLFGELVSEATKVVGKICSAIGGVAMEKAYAFSVGISPLGLLVDIAALVVKAICFVADLLTEKPAEESPEEIGLKAEICKEEEDLKPEDFRSVQEYIEYLRSQVILDPQRLESLSEEERQAYARVGAGLYVQNIEQRYGCRLEPEFWRAVVRAELAPEQTSALICMMQDGGIESGKSIDEFLAGTLPAGGTAKAQIYDLLAQMLREHPGRQDTVGGLIASYSSEDGRYGQ